MKLFQKILLTIFLFTSLNASQNEELIGEILDGAGIIDSLEQIDQKLKKKTNNNNYIKKFASLYDKEEIKDRIIDKLDDTLNDEDIDYLLDWYSSQSAVLITEKKKEHISLDKAKQLITNPKELLDDKNRFGIVLKINDALHISQFDYKIANILFTLKAKQTNKENLTDIEKYYLEKPQELERKIRNQSLVFLLYKFKDIQTSSLSVYLDFLETKSAQKLISTYYETLYNDINEILEDTIE